MKNKGIGQYDTEYSSCPCFWGTEPASYVRKFIEEIEHKSGKALDLGAGEGKNSLYLKKHGFDVTAIEVSRYAVKNFVEQLIQSESQDYPTVVLSDITKYPFEQQTWNLIVCYGVLHCLDNEHAALQLLDRIVSSTEAKGFNIISSFTNEIGVPEVQDYLSPLLLTPEFVLEYYKKLDGWQVVQFETGIITESHPTSMTPHQHSLYRIITKKIR